MKLGSVKMSTQDLCTKIFGSQLTLGVEHRRVKEQAYFLLTSLSLQSFRRPWPPPRGPALQFENLY
jgi:hypothetical protein